MTDSIKKTAHDISYHHRSHTSMLRALPLAKRSVTFGTLSTHIQQEVISELHSAEVVEILDHLDLSTAHKIIAQIKSYSKKKKVIKKLKGELREKCSQFLAFHPRASMTLLNFNYLLLPETTTIGETAHLVEHHYKETGKTPEILVEKDGNLKGEVPFSVLIKENNSDTLNSHIKNVEAISYKTESESIAEEFTKAKHKKIVVLDTDGSVLGIIYSDDALELLGPHATGALYDFAGVHDEEHTFDSVSQKVKHRYKWLIINLGTAFLAASVVGLFKETISQVVILAAYMPIVAGMGGNTATQTLAVIVRGITLGEVRLENGWKVIKNEAGAGIVNGLINGAIVMIIAVLWNNDPMLGAVVAVAMIFNLFIAGFFGSMIPLFMKWLGKDPATSATIFITTATDVFGFFAFLGLATIFLT
jgi:magnesium transporter